METGGRECIHPVGERKCHKKRGGHFSCLNFYIVAFFLVLSVRIYLCCFTPHSNEWCSNHCCLVAGQSWQVKTTGATPSTKIPNSKHSTKFTKIQNPKCTIQCTKDTNRQFPQVPNTQCPTPAPQEKQATPAEEPA